MKNDKKTKLYFLYVRELRAPMVQSMRAIGPRDPDLVVNALVDYPVIWNWLLTAVASNFHFLAFTFLSLCLCFISLFKILLRPKWSYPESICPCLWHVPCDLHLPSARALAQSLFGIYNQMKFIFSFIWVFKSSYSQVLSVTNIVHTIVIVLPTLFINFFGGAIAKFIDDQEVEFEKGIWP